MIVAGTNEVSSVSNERKCQATRCASTEAPKLEAANDIHIGCAGLLQSVSLSKHATLSDYRCACLCHYLNLYPQDAQASPLTAEDMFPRSADANLLFAPGDDIPVLPLTGLYQKMGLTYDEARRISKFESDLQKRWYIFRLNYNTSGTALEGITIPDCTFYMPDIKRRVKIKGQKKIISDPYMRNFFFAFTTRRIAEIIHATTLMPHSRIYYDHFRTDPLTGYNTPLTIPHTQMLDFMLIAEAKSFDKKILDPEKVSIPHDVFVEVIDGPFQGVRGFLTHVAGKQRVVTDTGFCLIATGYVSSYGYRILEETKELTTNNQ